LEINQVFIFFLFFIPFFSHEIKSSGLYKCSKEIRKV
jgi:hypothetical protein